MTITKALSILIIIILILCFDFILLFISHTNLLQSIEKMEIDYLKEVKIISQGKNMFYLPRILIRPKKNFMKTRLHEKEKRLKNSVLKVVNTNQRTKFSRYNNQEERLKQSKEKPKARRLMVKDVILFSGSLAASLVILLAL